MRDLENGEIGDSKKDKNRTKKKKKSLKEIEDELRAENERLHDTILGLMDNLDKAQSDNVEDDNLLTKNNELTEQLDLLNDQILEITDVNEDYKLKINKLQSNETILREEIAGLRENVNNLTSLESKLRIEIEKNADLQVTKETLLGEISQIKTEGQQQISAEDFLELQTSKKDMELELGEYKRRAIQEQETAEELKLKLDSANDTIRRLTEKASSLEEEIEHFQNKFQNEKMKLKETIETLTNENKVLKEQIGAIGLENNQSWKQRFELVNDKLEHATDDIENLRSLLFEEKQTSEDLRKELAQLRNNEEPGRSSTEFSVTTETTIVPEPSPIIKKDEEQVIDAEDDVLNNFQKAKMFFESYNV
eukprot:TRINITY_DN7078_c0_g1_i1.p2 TRINITY_DN7078_c0_g1~~TRINITY_DN7078_c0_g1_i1.p2  ORF type:complete len:365 (+),score=124.76 TRINITY_DN7078_c0_g1_i1:1664-2758(+)